MDLDLLRKHVADGVVYEQRHPTLPLKIYNYSPRCQYERLWDDVTLQCRGMVMYGEQIIARPFRKFFNDTEHADGEIPWHLPCEVTEKLDGSLLIAFYFDGGWRFATRGSFTSPQSREGELIFKRTYSCDLLAKGCTYLFEVIYPENRIVVDYRGMRDTILLGIVRNDGRELSLDGSLVEGLRSVRRLPPTAEAKSLRSIISDVEEGYVVRFENGFRVKVKGQRYMELHRLITGCSSRTIWECLSQGKSFDEMLAIVPDEFGSWVKSERAQFLHAFDALNQQVEDGYVEVRDLPDRKSKAAIVTSKYRHVAPAIFAAIDGKQTASILWKQLYPEFRRPEVAARIEA